MYEFDEEGTLQQQVDYTIPDSMVTIIHDIAVTEHYYVVVEGSVQFDVSNFLGQYLWSNCSVAECLVFNPEHQTQVHLIPRDQGAAGSASARIFPAPAFFSFHHAYAYELPEKQVVVLDTLAWNQVDFGNFNMNVDDDHLDTDYYRGGARTQLIRMVLNLKNGSTKMHHMARRTLEFPSVNWAYHGQPHRHIYAGGDVVDDDVYWAPLQCVCKLTADPLARVNGPLYFTRDTDLQSWYAGPRSFVLEPLFVPFPQQQQCKGISSSSSTNLSISDSQGKSEGNADDTSSHAANATSSSSSGGTEPSVTDLAEDAGWVIGTIYDASKGQGGLVIFDACNIAQGPLARINLPHHLSTALHGSWTNEYFGPEDESAVPQWKPPHQIRQL